MSLAANQINASYCSNPADLAKFIKDQFGQTIKNRYEIKLVLGQGSFGQVFLVNDKHANNEEKAMKTISLTGNIQQDSFFKEAKLFKSINCKFIIKYFEHFWLNDSLIGTGYLITEYCRNGDLANRIKIFENESKKFEESQILTWSIQATTALRYLNVEKKIAHRDIKPGNIFLTQNDEIKLGDLGCSRTIDSSNTTLTIGVGTLPYMSLEAKHGKYGFNSDIWSLGCIVYELVSLKKAFPTGFIDENLTPKPDCSFSNEFGEVLNKILNTDYTIRINSNQLYDELMKLKKSLCSYCSKNKNLKNYLYYCLACPDDDFRLCSYCFEMWKREDKAIHPAGHPMVIRYKNAIFDITKFKAKLTNTLTSDYCVSRLATLRDGILISAGHSNISIWNTETGEVTKTLKGHTHIIWSLKELRDGTLASGSGDKTIKIWNTQSGDLVRTLEGHTDLVYSLEELKYDGLLVSGSLDRTIKKWNTKTGELLNQNADMPDKVYQLVLLKDGNVLAIGFESFSQIILLNTKNLKEEKRIFCGGEINRITLLHDGSLATCKEKIHIWNTSSCRVLRTLGVDNKLEISSLLLLDDGNLASGYLNGEIKIWNPTSGHLIHEFKAHDKYISSITTLSDGSLVTCSRVSQEIKIWK